MSSNSPYASKFESMQKGVWRLEDSPLTFFEVTGADAVSWLQGQLTNDVRKLTPETPLEACMCSPTGQIVAILRVWNSKGRTILGVHNLGVHAVLDRFERMVILEDVAIQELPLHASIFLGLHSANYVDPLAELALPLNLTDTPGFAVLTQEPWNPEESIPLVDDKLLRSMEIEAGRPRFGFDTDAKTLPAELGQPFLDRTVNFDKGCYTGQEVIMRIHSRGHVNRRWVALVAPEEFNSEAEVFDGDDSVGKVLWGGSAIASAMIRSDRFRDGKAVDVRSPESAIRATMYATPIG